MACCSASLVSRAASVRSRAQPTTLREKASMVCFQVEIPAQFGREKAHMVNIWRGLSIGRAIGKRTDELLRRAIAGNLLFQVSEAFDEKEWRNG